MLAAINEKGGKIKPTHLLYKSNLSHSKMQAYLSELFAKNMVQENFNKNNKCYVITKNGIKFLEDYKKIKQFTDSFGF